MKKEQGRHRAVFAFTALLLVLGMGLTVHADQNGPDLVILHTNDIHGRIERAEGLLGMSMISSLVRAHREQFPNVLVMDAGDTIHGRPVANQLHGRSVVETMNIAGYDVMVPGNHDFNFGYERLMELEDLMEFDLVAANVYKDGELLFRPWVIREVGDFRIGIFGLATPDTYQTTHPNNIVGIEFADMVEAARRSVAELRAEDVDLVVALGHVGFGRNYPSTDVTAQVSGIDLFVDGHSHHMLPRGEWHDGTLFVQAHEYTKFLGRVDIHLSGGSPRMDATLISPDDAVAHGIEPDLAIEDLIVDLRDEVMQRMMGTWQD